MRISRKHKRGAGNQPKQPSFIEFLLYPTQLPLVLGALWLLGFGGALLLTTGIRGSIPFQNVGLVMIIWMGPAWLGTQVSGQQTKLRGELALPGGVVRGRLARIVGSLLMIIGWVTLILLAILFLRF